MWFLWTATTSGTATFQTCGGVTPDSKIAAWLNNNGGACPSGTQLAYNDDACALQSRVVFAVTSGTTYFLQIGAFTEGVTYTGTFTIAILPPPPPVLNDDCTTPTAIAGPGSYAFDIRAATTGAQGQTEALCLFFAQTGIVRDAWWAYTPTATGTATISTCGLLTSGTDTKIAIYDGSGCPAAAAIACADDVCGLTTEITWNVVCGQTYTIQLGGYPYVTPQDLAGSFTIVEVGSTCSTPPTAYCFGDGTGTACPCGNSGAAGNGCANSLFAAGANLTASGTASISADTLVLSGSNMPNSSALYFQGTTQAGAGLGTVFGDGLRCAGGSVIRLGTKNNAANASSYPQGGDPSVSVRGAVAAPGTRTYQIWYRNAAAFCTADTFNLSNGIQVNWGA